MRLSSESQSRSTQNSSADRALTGHRPELFTGQKADILRALSEGRGNWVPAYKLASIALQYNARVKELRDVGYVIKNKTERVGRQVHGSFCLVSCPGEQALDERRA